MMRDSPKDGVEAAATGLTKSPDQSMRGAEWLYARFLRSSPPLICFCSASLGLTKLSGTLISPVLKSPAATLTGMDFFAIWPPGALP